MVKHQHPDPAKMRILITNDDGISAPGLGVLERVARSFTDDVWVVAPDTEQSGASHSLTPGRPLRLKEFGPKRFSVNGTPTDTVLVAVEHVMKDRRPDLVLSGVNHGSNAGGDVTYSGTVAAAMEATIMGIPAVAFSQYYGEGEAELWETSAVWAPRVLAQALATRWPADVLLNVNFPYCPPDAVKGIRVVRQATGTGEQSVTEVHNPRGSVFFWLDTNHHEKDAPEDTDLGALIRGQIAVTPLCLDLTDRKTLAALQLVFLQTSGQSL